MGAQDRVLEAIKNTLTANGIDLPFPTQQILLHDQTEVTDGDHQSQREGWPAGGGDVPKSRAEVQQQVRAQQAEEPAAAAPPKQG